MNVEHLHVLLPLNSSCSLSLPSSLSFNSSTFSTSSSSTDSEFLRDLIIGDSDLDSERIVQLKNLLLRYPSCLNNKPGRTSLTQHHIDTGTSKPIKLRPCRVSPARQNVIAHQIQQMLNDGIIEPANDP